MKKMENSKAVGLYNIPILVQKCLGEGSILWLTKLLNGSLNQKGCRTSGGGAL